MPNNVDSFPLLLSESVSKEKTRTWLGTLVFCVSALGAVFLYLWRCRFGADLTDEAFYLVPAWKTFLLGDKPFANEYLNGMRQFDILNFLLVRPWLPYSVLAIRRAAVLVYALCLLTYLRLVFKRKIGLTASLAFVLCLTFDYFLMPTWSYNWWVRNCLLLHHAALYSAATQSTMGRRWYLFAAGLVMGIAVVAYNSLLPAIFAGAILIAFGGSYLSRKKGESWKASLALFYLAGAAVVCLPDALYLVSVRHDWLASVRAMVTMSDYAGTGLPAKAIGLVRFLFERWQLWALVGVLFVFDSDSSWTDPVRKIANRAGRLRAWIAFPFLALFLTRFFHAREIGEVLGDYVALGVCGAFVLGVTAIVHRDIFRLTSVVLSLMVATGMALSSANGYLAFFWVMPTLIIPFLAEETDDVTSRLRPLNAKRVFTEGSGHALLLVFVGAVLFGSFQYQRHNTYYDVPPGNCTTKLSLAPLEGVQTSDRRAFLIQEIARLVDKNPFVLTFSEISGPLLFSAVRPSMDTGLVERVATEETNRRSILKMWKENRFPSIIIKANVRPWYWGVQHPLAHIPMEYSKNDLMLKFSSCIRGITLARYEEFDAYSVAPEKIGPCVQDLAGS